MSKRIETLVQGLRDGPTPQDGGSVSWREGWQAMANDILVELEGIVEELDFVLAPVADKPEQTFVEVENMDGQGVRLGEYVLRDDGFHAIRFFGVVVQEGTDT